ncbi:helix-turn-helix domain-containing protein [Kitasatospora sp. NBC_01250]|uniref:AraC family transcriptional regulator n=1 Tax=Kitasatospora sp. NBC_01250 TaxID=2903571 RepID=UPI00324CFE1C
MAQQVYDRLEFDAAAGRGGVRTIDLRVGTGPEGSWELVRAAPAGAPGSGVAGYRGYRLALHRPQRRLEVPSGLVTLLLEFGGSLRLGRVGRSLTGDPQAGWTRLDSLFAGLQTEPTVAEHDGRLCGIEVLLEPWLAYTVLGVGLHELHGVAVPVRDLLGWQGALLAERLAGTPRWSDRFALVDAFLLERVACGRPAAEQVVHAWRQVVRSGGDGCVGGLGAAVGWSERHLELRFREQIGLSPKRAARLLRLRHSLRLLEAGCPPARIAVACGFYDQAHYAREFKAMTGCTPAGLRQLRAMPERPVDRLPGRATSVLLRGRPANSARPESR